MISLEKLYMHLYNTNSVSLNKCLLQTHEEPIIEFRVQNLNNQISLFLHYDLHELAPE